MTCVIGWVRSGHIYMGADNIAATGSMLMQRSDEKVFIKDKMIYGFTSSYRMGDLLRYNLTTPSFPEGMDVNEYMCSLYINAVRKLFKDSGFTTIKDNEETGGQYLVGFKGRLYSVDNDYQVGIPGEDFWACGCGTPYALGAIKALLDANHPLVDPVSTIEGILKVAEYYSPFVRGPFKIMSL